MPQPKVSSQEFYTEPPFSYRPSVAEYLATFKVTINGVIADLLHLDKKGNIEIESYSGDELAIKLKSGKDLNDNELLLWKFLESKQLGEKKSERKAKLNISDLKPLVKSYEAAVMANANQKFGSNVKYNPSAIPGGFVIFGLICSIVLSIIGSFFSIFTLVFALFASVFISWLIGLGPESAMAMLPFLSALFSLPMPFLIIYFLSSRKLSKSPIEKKFLLKEIIWQLLKLMLMLYAFVLSLMAVFFLAVAGSAFFPINFSYDLGAFLPLVILLYITLMVFYYSRFGRIAYRFFYWLFEKPESENHRQKWLHFKDFISKYSELRERPVKYYELWDEFYYYALAVGAVKKP